MWTISKYKTWTELQQFDWVRDMHGVPQSPVHHAEGDVAIHTQLVLRELEGLHEYRKLPDEVKEIVWASALMHDIEKRSTTSIDESGNIVSPGHAKKGAFTARQILYRDIETPFEIRESIVGLVRYHGLPLWAFEKPDPVKALLKASHEVDTQLLVILATADILGRVCSDQQEMLYRIELFKEFCIEQDCWGKPKAFPTELSKFLYFRKEDQSPDYVPFDTGKSEVILLSGIAGSGKDHYVKQAYPDYKVISLDNRRRELKVDYKDAKGNGRIIQEAKELAKSYARNQIPFVWNATNITTQMREQLIDLLAVYDPVIKLVYLEVPYRKLLSQNRNRDFPIPSSAVERMIDKLEVPKPWEAHQVHYIVH